MNPPQLHHRYSYNDAIRSIAGDQTPRSLCGGQWLIFDQDIICFALIGPTPASSHSSNGSTFNWVADRKYVLHDGEYDHFLPTEVIASKATCHRIHLFAHSDSFENYLYLGQLHPSTMQRAPSSQSLGLARFELHQTLPIALWRQLGGTFNASDIDDATIDADLARLRRPTTPADRFEILQKLVEYWHGPIVPEDGIPHAELAHYKLPAMLRNWYAWAGRRNQILSLQNRLLPPEKIRVEDEHLLFYVENQCVYQWAVLPEGEDPQVFGRYNEEDEWEKEEILLTEHLIVACLFEAIMAAPYGASAACLNAVTLSRIEETIPKIAISPWHWCNPTQFYAARGAWMFSMGNGKDIYSVWIGARTQAPLQFLKPFLNDSWEYKSI